jgi:hypothetical protein
MRNIFKFITLASVSVLFSVFSSTKALAEREVSSELLQILKLSEERSECISYPGRAMMVRIPTLNGHSRPACILFDATVDIDSGSSLRTWNWRDEAWYVSGKLRKNQIVYVMESNSEMGNQPTVLVGIPKTAGAEPDRFAVVELRYLRYFLPIQRP